jgi:hypothetical protein
MTCFLPSWRYFLIAFISCWAGLTPIAETVRIDERDGKVLEAVLLKLRDDPKFYCTREEISRTNIAFCLIAERLEKDEGLKVYFGGDPSKLDNQESIFNRLRDSEEQVDIESRNHMASNAQTNRISFRGLKFPPGVVVGERNFGDLTFYETYPTAKGWIAAFLPGYSKNGKRALFSASVGPSSHGALLIAMLEEVNGKWIVLRYRTLRFA